MPANLPDPVKEASKAATSDWKPEPKYKDAWDFYKVRKEELLTSRRYVKGIDLDKVYSDAEKNYLPHRVTVQKPRKIDNSRPLALIKVQTALSIVLNPVFDATFSPGAEKYRKTNEFIKGLTMYTLDPAITSTRQQYFNTAFNVALHGNGALRTYRRFEERMIYGPDNLTRIPLVDRDEVDAESLHPKDYWLDDMAIPGDRNSHNDWMWRKVYSFRTFKRKFPDTLFPEFKNIMPGGNTAIHVNDTQTKTTLRPTKDLIEVYFYENKGEDMFLIEANKICHFSPLPQQSKALSLSHGIWMLRATDTAYGIGLWEVLEQDQQLIDMVRNMSIEQLVLSIFSMVFHDGTNKVDEDKLRVEAGRFYKFLSPDKIKQFQLNGPGQDSINFLQQFYQEADETTGISKVLSAESSDKTAFQANLNQEAGLRRLKVPSNNLKELYEWEMSNRVPMIQQVYSVPSIKQISDVNEMESIKQNVADGKLDPADIYVDSQDQMFTSTPREVPLNIQEQSDGNYAPTDQSNFFKIKPGMLDWRGVIRIKVESLLVGSETLQKQITTELATFLAPYIQQMAAQPGVAETYVPFLKNIILAYKESPEKWIPKKFLLIADQAETQLQQEQVAQGQQPAPSQAPDQGVPTPPEGPPAGGPGIPPQPNDIAAAMPPAQPPSPAVTPQMNNINIPSAATT